MKLRVAFSILLFSLIFSKSQGQNTPNSNRISISDLQACDQLFNSARSPAEKLELQKDYWTLLGIVADLANYKEQLNKYEKPINLFPTAYYYTTLLEMQRIVSLRFTYPIEKMKQMIAFYDAYKWNRNAWDNGLMNNVEPHWKTHFELCVTQLPGKNLCWAGLMLTSAINAHVKCDLPRAIRYANQNKFDRNLDEAELKKEFYSTDSVLYQSELLTIQDLKTACTVPLIDLTLLIPGIIDNLAEINQDVLLKSHIARIYYIGDVIDMRHKSWQLAFSGRQVVNLDGYPLLGQPTVDHSKLLIQGKSLCPPAIELVAVTPIISPPIKRSIDPNTLTGGASPDALGRVLLKAIKTNNRKLWVSCIHPVTQNPDGAAHAFDIIRNKLEEAGVTKWELLEFIRVTFHTNSPGVFAAGLWPGDAEFKGESLRVFFKVEFTYRNKEFSGSFGDSPIMTFHHKNYLLSGYITEAYLTRL